VRTAPILPGATLGVLGSGQLGRMFTIAARQLGYRVNIYSPDTETPAGQVGDLEIAAPYEDLARVREFARGVSAVTFEFENVPSATSRACAEVTPVRDIDGIRMDTPMQVPRYFFQRWCPAVKAHAASLGKNDFFIFGEFYCARERAATMVGRGKSPNQWGFFSKAFTN